MAAITPTLPDPRRYPQGAHHALLGIGGEAELRGAIDELLAAHRDDEIRRALGAAPSRDAYSRLWHALCAATEAPLAPGESVLTRVFAIPVVIVSGARQGASVGGALPDGDALGEVLRRSGALGASRNFGLGNALCSLEALEGLPPSAIRDWSLPGAPGAWARAISPEPIAVRSGEEAHLRFLLGAAIMPVAAPSLAETAAHIGAWGLAFARELGAQIATAGTELLALPRPPGGVLRAGYAGRRAQLEVALNLFMSSAIRRCRSVTGDPVLVISAHAPGAAAGAELRVSLSSVLDEGFLEGYRWPLHPLDDPGEIARAVRELAADCRLSDVRIVETVLAPGGSGNAPLFVRANAALAMRH